MGMDWKRITPSNYDPPEPILTARCPIFRTRGLQETVRNQGGAWLGLVEVVNPITTQAGDPWS